MADKKWESFFSFIHGVSKFEPIFQKSRKTKYVSCNFQALNLMQEFNNKKSEKSPD